MCILIKVATSYGRSRTHNWTNWSRQLQVNPKLKVEIAGHTDAVGDARLNHTCPKTAPGSFPAIWLARASQRTSRSNGLRPNQTRSPQRHRRKQSAEPAGGVCSVGELRGRGTKCQRHKVLLLRGRCLPSPISLSTIQQFNNSTIQQLNNFPRLHSAQIPIINGPANEPQVGKPTAAVMRRTWRFLPSCSESESQEVANGLNENEWVDCVRIGRVQEFGVARAGKVWYFFPLMEIVTPAASWAQASSVISPSTCT